MAEAIPGHARHLVIGIVEIGPPKTAAGFKLADDVESELPHVVVIRAPGYRGPHSGVDRVPAVIAPVVPVRVERGVIPNRDP
jgi:hypothetical protein